MKKSVAAIGLSLSLMLPACSFNPAPADNVSPVRACSYYEDEILDIDEEGQCYETDGNEGHGLGMKWKKKKAKSVRVDAPRTRQNTGKTEGTRKSTPKKNK